MDYFIPNEGRQSYACTGDWTADLLCTDNYSILQFQ